MLDKAIELQLIKNSECLLRILRFRAQSNHHAHHLLIDVLSGLVALHALLVDLPATLKILSFRVAIDQGCVANHIRYESHVFPHISEEVLSFLELSGSTVGQQDCAASVNRGNDPVFDLCFFVQFEDFVQVSYFSIGKLQLCISMIRRSDPKSLHPFKCFLCEFRLILLGAHLHVKAEIAFRVGPFVEK